MFEDLLTKLQFRGIPMIIKVDTHFSVSQLKHFLKMATSFIAADASS